MVTMSSAVLFTMGSMGTQQEIRTAIHTCIHALQLHTDIHSYIHAAMNACMQTRCHEAWAGL